MNKLCIKRFDEKLSLKWNVKDISTSSKDTNYFISETFKFAGTSWRLLLSSKITDDSETSLFTFISVDYCSFSVDYIFSLEIQDDNFVEIASGSVETNKQSPPLYAKFMHNIKFKEVLKPIPKDITFLGFLKSRMPVLDEPKPKKLKKMETLSQNFYNLYKNEEFCDVTLDVRGQKFNVHKAVLVARSPVFAAMFRHDTLERQDGVINVEDCDPASFPEFLRFVYCGKIDNLTYSMACNLYAISDKYNIEELKLFCKQHLMETLQFNTWPNIYILADLHNDKELKTAAENFFHENLVQIWKTTVWKDFMKNNHDLASKILEEIPESKVPKFTANVLQ